MPHAHGYAPRRYVDSARPESWGLYSEAEAQWLPVLFASREDAAMAANLMTSGKPGGHARRRKYA